MSESIEERIMRLRAEADQLESKLALSASRRIKLEGELGRELNPNESDYLDALIEAEPLLSDARDRLDAAKSDLLHISAQYGIPVRVPRADETYTPPLWGERYAVFFSPESRRAFGIPESLRDVL